MRQIPFFSLAAQVKDLGSALHRAWRQTVDSSGFILGDAVEQFEKRFARFVGTRFAVGVNSGLDALGLALRACGIDHRHEVILPANTFIATALAVSQVGAKVVLVDVDPQDALMDPRAVQRAITRRTRAILPVHLYGQPVDFRALQSIGKNANLLLIEDAAQAHGARFQGKPCGSLGRIAGFSFYPSKNLGAFGDGGAITTDDEDLWQKIQVLRNYGAKIKYVHTDRGVNSRLDALQARILTAKLGHLKEWNQCRNQLARRYREGLSHLRWVKLPRERKGSYCVYHLYVIQSERRDLLQKFLESRGIGTGIHYPVPIHLQGAYRDLGHRRGDFPVAERLAQTILSLPMYPELRLRDVDFVCENITEFFRHPHRGAAR